jgi:hypothetical protein
MIKNSIELAQTYLPEFLPLKAIKETARKKI